MSQNFTGNSTVRAPVFKRLCAKPVQEPRSVFRRLGPQLPPPTESSRGVETIENSEFKSFNDELEAFKKLHNRIKLTAEQLDAELDEHVKNTKTMENASVKRRMFNARVEFIIAEMEGMGLDREDKKVERLNFLLKQLSL